MQASTNDVKIKWPLITAIIIFLIAIIAIFEATFLPNSTFSFVNSYCEFKYKDIHVFKIAIYPYRTACILGAIGIIIMSVIRRHIINFMAWQAIITGILLTISGIVGAKILFLIENPDLIKTQALQFGGLSFWGSVFFIPIIMSIIGLLFKRKPIDYCDYCAPSCLLMLAFLRIGCFLEGCCQGIWINLSDASFRMPIQLFECFLDLILLNIILSLEKKYNPANGLYIMFMGGYGIIRLYCEFLRDTPKNHLFLSNGQVFSLISIAILLIFLITKYFHQQNRK